MLLKRDVETLIAGYDADPVASLVTALRVVLDMPDAAFVSLVAAAPFTSERRARLLAGDVDSLDELARDLNETRTLMTHDSS